MSELDREPNQAPAQCAPAQLSPLAVALLDFITDREHMGASFGALTGFMEAHGVPWRGPLTFCMIYNNTTIFWRGWSNVAAGALAELHERFFIHMYAMTDPDDPVTRLEWQGGSPLPLARQPRKFYKTRRFLPVRFFADGNEPTRNAVEIGEGWTCAGR